MLYVTLFFLLFWIMRFKNEVMLLLLFGDVVKRGQALVQSEA